ncbi:restriction endonuclease subunit S [Phocaeicola plebeius]|uniref:restriction endonuclease subunit S n=1 Tax=Phocaeicola plebeius TaxID=310297 RepID=UPI003AF07FC3
MENRYDKYKDSGIAWIGEIPEHWEVCKLSTLFFQHKQKNNNSQESNLLSLSYGNIKRKDINTSEGLLPESFDNYNIIDKNDIVFRLTDLQNDKKSLRSALCKERGIITSAYVTIRKRGNINSSYFNYLFRVYDECKVFYGMGDGVRQGVNFDDLRKLDVLLPQQIQQQSIATYLDQKCGEIDELITLQEEMITKLQSYKQSVITEAVTKGLDKNVPLKDSGIEWIGEFPEHWKVVKIKYLAKIKSGDSISSNEIIQEGIYEVYGGNGLMGYCNKKNVNGFNIIIGRVGALCGNVRLISESKYITDNALILNCFDNALYPYMYIMLKAANLNNLNTSNAQPLITGSKVLNVSLPIPPLSEQQSITDYLDRKCSEIDELISIKQQKIEKLKDYKKSLIFECVTGKRKV